MKRNSSNVLKALLVGSGLLILWAAAGACGSDDDPLASRCESVCEVDPADPCATGDFEARCVADCRALAGEAASQGFKGTACGECIADQFAYSGKRCKNNQVCTFGGDKETCEGSSCDASLEVCFGAQGPSGIDIPACTALCIEVE